LAVMVCGLAEAAVTETEHEDDVPEGADSEQLEAGENTSVGTEEVNDTVPVGAVAAPAAVFVTVTVTVEGCPTTTDGFENAMPVEAASAVPVGFAWPRDV